MEGCRGVGAMGSPRGEGDSKTFHKNSKLNILFILIFKRQVCRKHEKAVLYFLILKVTVYSLDFTILLQRFG